MVTPKAPIPRKGLILAASLAAFLLASGAIYFTHSSNAHKSPMLSQVPNLKQVIKGASNNSPTSTQGSQANQVKLTANSVTSLPVKSGLLGYVNQQNKFGFYVQKQQGDQQYSVKESGDKVYIYNTKTQQTPAYTQIFQKATNDSIQQAITKAVLTGYNPQDCPITVENMTVHTFGKTIQTARINYAPNNVPSYGAGIGDITKCPHNFTVDEDAPYFLVDSNHPNILLFIFNGQIAVSGGTDDKGNPLTWSDTFKFVN